MVSLFLQDASENEGWPMPIVEESYNPDRTRLSLEFTKKQAKKTSEENKRRKQAKIIGEEKLKIITR